MNYYILIVLCTLLLIFRSVERNDDMKISEYGPEQWFAAFAYSIIFPIGWPIIAIAFCPVFIDGFESVVKFLAKDRKLFRGK